MLKNILALIALIPVALCASGEATGPTDIIPRTINFLIFAAILYYLVAAAAKAFYIGRKEGIAGKLNSIQVKLKESNSKKEAALQKVEEAKATVKAMIETAKKEAILLDEKIAADAIQEIENMERSQHDKMHIEERKMQRSVVEELLEELFKEGNFTLGHTEMVQIIQKKVA